MADLLAWRRHGHSIGRASAADPAQAMENLPEPPASRSSRCCLLLLGVACFIIFSDQRLLPFKLHVLAFAVFPFVLWAAIRFGVSGCASSTLLIAVIATAKTARGVGPFAQDTPLTNALLLQAFFGVISLSGLTLAAVIAEREDLESEREQLIRDQVLREARLQLAAIVESSADAIISKDMDGRITHWNQGAEQLYGYSSQEMIGKSVALLMPPERSDDFPDIMAEAEQKVSESSITKLSAKERTEPELMCR